MKPGRPRKYKKNVNITVSMEDQKVNEIDSLRGTFSRGEFFNILITSDNFKTKSIIDLKKQVEELKQINNSLSKKDNTNLISFQNTIHSHFRKYYADYLEKMPIYTKKFWAKKLSCQTKELLNYL